jgi:hypothetical protein
MAALCPVSEGTLVASTIRDDIAEPAQIVLEPSAAEHGRDVARRFDGGHEAVFGHDRIERNRRSNDFGIRPCRENKHAGTGAVGSGAHGRGKCLRRRYILRPGDAGRACKRGKRRDSNWSGPTHRKRRERRSGSAARSGCRGATFACRKSSPSILVMQSTQDRTAQNASCCLGGT